MGTLWNAESFGRISFIPRQMQHLANHPPLQHHHLLGIGLSIAHQQVSEYYTMVGNDCGGRRNLQCPTRDRGWVFICLQISVKRKPKLGHISHRKEIKVSVNLIPKHYIEMSFNDVGGGGWFELIKSAIYRYPRLRKTLIMRMMNIWGEGKRRWKTSELGCQCLYWIY